MGPRSKNYWAEESVVGREEVKEGSGQMGVLRGVIDRGSRTGRRRKGGKAGEGKGRKDRTLNYMQFISVVRSAAPAPRPPNSPGLVTR